MKNYSASNIEKKLKNPMPSRIMRKIISAVLKLFLALILTAVVGGSIFSFHLIDDIIEKAPDISRISESPIQAATYICSQEGKRVQKLTLPEANRDLVTLGEIPKSLQYAVVAIEDSRFYQHHGVDPRGILRAAFKGLTTGSFSEGASTITQQLLKNSVFPDWTKESTFRQRLTRKLQEQYLALKLEKVMTKDQILEDYLNMINLGAGCYGVQAASYRYFGKSVSDLSLSEAAVIAGITQNPTAYNPLTYPENNKKRRLQVLDAMLSQGYISKKQYDTVLADDVYSRLQSKSDFVDTTSTVYSYYQDALIDQVMQDLQDEKGYTRQQAYQAVYSGGLRIYSAQDDALQKICDEEFQNTANFPSGTEVGIDYALSVQDSTKQVTDYGNDDLKAYVRSTSDPSFNLMFPTDAQAKEAAAEFRQHVVKSGDTVLGERISITPQPQASCVLMDESTGLVKALVGGRGVKEASLTLNRASYTLRQPGSTFKILTVYAPALDTCGKTLASTYVDEPYNYADGTPVSNADKTYQGEVTIRDAIIRSINVVAVKCLTEITPKLGFDYAEKFGITSLAETLQTDSGTLTDIGQTLALGGISRGVSNLELTASYAAIADKGRYIAPKFYTKVLDHNGDMVLDNTSPGSRTVIKESTATLLTSAMRDVVSDKNGTAYGLISLGAMPVAGKTGTTNDYRDSWFVGFTPYYTCGIWAGYDNNDKLPDTDLYHTYSKVLWNAIMSRISSQENISAFSSSSDVEKVMLCPQTHLVAAPGCPNPYEELFAKGTAPQTYCNVHGNGGPVETDTADADEQAGISPDAITIYNTDQTTIPAADAAQGSGTSAGDSSAQNSGASAGDSSAQNSGASAGDSSAQNSGASAGDSSAQNSGTSAGEDVIQILNNIPPASG